MNDKPILNLVDMDAEAAMLASFMLGDGAVRGEIAQTCQPWMVEYPYHGMIYRAMLAMQGQGKPIDPVLLAGWLKDHGNLEDAGGIEYVAQVLQTEYTGRNGPAYAKRVAEKANRRAIIQIANELRASAEDTANDVREVAAQAIDRYAKLLAGTSGVKIWSAADLMERLLSDIENPEESRFIKTGLGPLDDVITGLEPGTNTIIAARPSMGKSTIARQLLSQIAMMGTPVGILSLEESAPKVARNLGSKWATVANSRIRKPKELDLDELKRLQDAAAKVGQSPLYLVDSVRRWADMEATARLMVTRFKLQVLAIDHIHLIDGFGGKSDTERTTAASHAVKWLYKQLGVAGITVCQLNRGNERESNREPTMSDLRQSGELEQDADTILLLHRESYYKGGQEGDDGPTDVIVAKQRDSVRNVKVTLNTELKYCRFTEQVAVNPF